MHTCHNTPAHTCRLNPRALAVATLTGAVLALALPLAARAADAYPS